MVSTTTHLEAVEERCYVCGELYYRRIWNIPYILHEIRFCLMPSCVRIRKRVYEWMNRGSRMKRLETMFKNKEGNFQLRRPKRNYPTDLFHEWIFINRDLIPPHLLEVD